MNLIQQFRKHWQTMQFDKQGNSFLLAVSGGSDSMVLASLFLEAGLQFGVAHCNFRLRGEEADNDERLVSEWCAENQVSFFVTGFDTKQKATEWKKGTQETARILRYEWFEKTRVANGYSKIVTAHHANDNVETLFINLCKGTGISGIHGILPVQGNVFRPLLFATKDMLVGYADEKKLEYRIDASNNTDDYLRNSVRHKLIPVIEQLFTGAVNNINESITRFGEVEQIYRKAIEQDRKKLVEKRGQDYYIPVLKLMKYKPLTTILYELMQPFSFSSAQIPDVISLLSAETGRYVSSATNRIIRNRDFLIVTSVPTETTDIILIEAVPSMVTTSHHQFSFSIIEKPEHIKADSNIAVLDMKGIVFPIILRKWKMGDYFYPFGMKMKKKKVSRLLIDEKIALHQKENIWVLECNKKIAWVAGIRLDERFRVKETTEKVLMVKCTSAIKNAGAIIG